MAFERPITKKMKAQQEAELFARLEVEYQAEIARQRAYYSACVEQTKAEWENLLRSLPSVLNPGKSENEFWEDLFKVV